MKVSALLCLFMILSCKTDPPADNMHIGKQVQQESQREDIDVVAAYEWINSDNAPVIIDVRTPSEFAEGYIQGSTLIDYKSKTFEDEILKLDKNASYLIYCRSGGRSSKATDFMISQGFKDVTNMEGGYLDWSDKY